MWYVKKLFFLFLFSGLYLPAVLFAQHPPSHVHVTNVESQPVLAQAIRLQGALSFLGSSLSKEDEKRLKDLQHQPPTPEDDTIIKESQNK